MTDSPKLLDAHCHLDLYPDMEGAMRQCASDGVAAITVTTTPRAWPRNRDLARRFSHVNPALGLHPQLVSQFPSDIEVWDSYFSEAKIIGEVGLDASPRFYGSLGAQKEVFTHVLKACARSGDKVLSVHSVRASKTVLDMIEDNLSGSGCMVIMHWFTGTAAEAQRAVGLGCYFSVNAEMLRKPQHISTVKSLPLHRLLTETDGPFTMVGSNPAAPSDVCRTVESLAGSLGMDRESLRVTLLDNYRSVMEG